MSIIKRLKWKDKSGKTTDYDLGAKASNVEQDATHRFVSDTEKQTWNGKADPGDIPSGAAADYGVANNDTTNRADMLSTAQVAYQHGKEIDQLNSEIEDAKQELGGIEYGTVTVTSAVTADIKGVHKINKTAYLTLHGKTVTHALTSGIAHFQSSIPPASPVYIPYFIMGGASSRVQMAYMDQNGNISLAGGEDININEWFLFSTSYRTT